MKAYFYLIIAIVISFVISLNNFKIFSIDEVSIFLTVVGLIYGLMAAFTISNSWEKFSKIRDAVSEEVASLEAVYIYSKSLSDKISFKKIKEEILGYCKEVPEVEWREYWGSKNTHNKFRNLMNAVVNIKLKTKKDEALFEEISEELRDASSSRNTQLVLSQTKISRMQWTLNLFLSAILIIGLLFLSIPNYFLSIFIVSSMVASVIMILFVIYELDSLKISEAEVSIAPYEELVNLIAKDKI